MLAYQGTQLPIISGLVSLTGYALAKQGALTIWLENIATISMNCHSSILDRLQCYLLFKCPKNLGGAGLNPVAGILNLQRLVPSSLGQGDPTDPNKGTRDPGYNSTKSHQSRPSHLVVPATQARLVDPGYYLKST